jgi:hypothetical protein
LLALVVRDLESNCRITNVKNVSQSPEIVHNTHLAHDLDRNATPNLYKSILILAFLIKRNTTNQLLMFEIHS